MPGTSIFTYATLADDANPTNGDGFAFGAIASPGLAPTLQMPNPPLGFGTLLSTYTGAGVGLQPMMADNNEVVFQDGNGPTFPIVLNVGPGINLTIASSADFSVLGAAPGISPDGQVVAFYGNLTADGAAALNNAQPSFAPLTAGPGIFASVLTASNGRVIVRVAGEGGQAIQGIPNVATFDVNDRVDVTSVQPDDDAVTVVFMGQDSNGNDGIYVNQVDFFGSADDPSGFRPNINTLVAEVGDTLTNVSGTIRALNIDDSINSAGQVAFWVDTSADVNAVLVANPVPVLAVTPLNQGNPDWAGLPYAGGGIIANTQPPKSFTIGNNGCALTSLAMALNYVGAPDLTYDGMSGFTPATLNDLLEAVGGYAVHSVDWDLATDIAAFCGDVPGLSFNYVKNNVSSQEELTYLLTTYHEPVIVGVNIGPKGPHHFVLVTGMVGSQFTIDDPDGGVITTLGKYKNDFVIRGYISDPSDVSELSIVAVGADPGLDLLVTDPDQQQTGTDPATGNAVNGIPQAVTFSDALEVDPGSSSDAEIATFVAIAQPPAGSYSIAVGGTTPEPYTIYASPIATDGTLLTPTTFTGDVTSGSVSTFTLAYSPTPPGSTPPTITANPTSQVAGAGDSVSFTAAAIGKPAPTVQWQVSTDGGNTFSNIAGATSAALTFSTTTSENGDEYRAVFTNSSGTATSAPATLTVNTTPGGLVISAANGVFPQFKLAPPPQSSAGGFGAADLTLSNGNILVTAAGLSTGPETPAKPGAVYLYNGQTGALISSLTGVLGPTVTALTNGNFVVAGIGTATWGSGTTGVSGTVSVSNSLVEGGTPGAVDVTPLTNGNYVVDFIGWNGDTGAVAWGNGTTGTTGTVSAANSLVGSNFGDWVGGGGGSIGGVTALANGNYVVNSPYWNNYEGAATLGNGTTGITGTISAANSLIGGVIEESVDDVDQTTVTPLPSGNYVVSNSQWNDEMGEVTWGSGTTGVDGVVSAANSLVGSTGGNDGDVVGTNVTVLTNGNYVVDSPDWKLFAGAVTWGSETAGVSGTISAANSLVGNGQDAMVGSGKEPGGGTGAVTALTNGNYVVDSSSWNGDIGAVTWGNGTTGTVGVVSAANSLVGSNQLDSVGAGTTYSGLINGVTALTNGNYVVDSPNWNDDEGAATWGNGATGTIGTVSVANSLVGSHPYNNQTGLSDSVGDQGVTALTNGNYVVDSSSWNGATGAVTWGNGTTGTIGIVSSANSLVGSYAFDRVGGYDVGGVTALANGNYVVTSPNWNNQVGAATWGNGTTGTIGTISSANSLVGSVSGDQVGSARQTYQLYGVAALPNGNYVVLSPNWNNQVGAATWGNGTTGVTGTISSANSLIAGGANNNYPLVIILPNSNYLVISNSGATWEDGDTGVTLDGSNTPEAQNSVSGNGLEFEPIASGNSFILGSIVGFTDPNELTYALGQGQTITVTPGFLTRTLDAGTDVTIQSNDDITVDSPITEASTSTPASLTLEAGRSILINASINTAGGNLSWIANDSVADGVIDSERDPGEADITMTSGATLDTGSGSLLVDLEQSTDKTNNGRGGVTLLGVDASAFTLPAGSTLGVSINGTAPGDGVAAGTYSQLVVSGSIDLNTAALEVTTSTAIAAGTTFTIVQSGAVVSGTFNGLAQGSLVVAANGSEFTISYLANGGEAVVLTALGTTSTTPPAVTVVAPATGPTSGGTRVTITGANLEDATAVNFGSMQVISLISDTASQIIVSSPGGSGTVNVTVQTADGQSAISSADQFSYFPSLGISTNLSAVSGSGTSGGTAALTSTLTADAVPLAGRTVTFTLIEGGTVTTVGTATTGANGVATLTGVSLAGLNAGSYTGAVGASFGGDSTYAGSSASGTLVINATTTLMITGEHVLFHRKTNKKGKPIGNAVLSGFLFDFSEALDPSSATSAPNYQVDSISTKRVKKQTRHILHPITRFSVTYSAANDSVTLTFAGKQRFPTGGQVTVVPGPPAGVTGASGIALAGNNVFTISAGGKKISSE